MRLNLVVGLLLTKIHVTLSAQEFELPWDENVIEVEGPYTPKIRTKAEFLVWQQQVELAVRDLEQSNSTSRAILNTDSLRTVLSGLFAKAKGKLGCDACIVGVDAASRVAKLPGTKSPMLATFKSACKFIKQPKSVCHGIIGSTGPIVFDILSELDLRKDQVHHMTCFALGNHCPSPELDLKPLRIPQPNVAKMKRLQPQSGEYKYIAHISDLHYDAEYKVGAETDCKKPICCQDDSNSDEDEPQVIHRPAHPWGEYKCDINRQLLNSLLSDAGKRHDKFNLDMLLFTGDVPAHDMWKEAKHRAMDSEAEAYGLIDRHFASRTKIYPVIGNHEAVPVNQFPIHDGYGSKDYFLYDFVAKQWKDWLPDQALNSVRHGGFYSIQHNDNLKIIVLNNNLCYTLNFYLLLNPNDNDPNGMLKWLISELYQAELSGTRVYLVSHVPPGGTDCYRQWSDSFNDIIKRYHKIISGQFYGHTHFDEFQIFYGDDIKTPDTAISHAYLAPSITTFGGLNPGYRIYKVDAVTYEVIDYTQYYADLTEKNTWLADAEWKVLYSARATYGRGLLRTRPSMIRPLAYDDSLSPRFWHEVTSKFNDSRTLFDTYYNLRTKNGPSQTPCDDECRATTICTLRAGRSRDSCAEVNPFE